MKGLMWFRRDLRLHDNTALAAALAECSRVHCCFLFDRDILDRLEDRADRRVLFIHQSVVELAEQLRQRGGALRVLHGFAHEEIPRLAAQLAVDRVYANHDYEPARIKRDEAVRVSLSESGRALRTLKDHVIFEKEEILNNAGRPFRVFTHYRNAWHRRLRDDDLQPRACDEASSRLAQHVDIKLGRIPSLGDLGFRRADLDWPGGTKTGRALLDAFMARISNYARDRDYPALDATSHLSVHLRFGTLSIREAIREALDEGSEGAKKWVDELVWREFYNALLYHFPHTQTRPFIPAYEILPWRHDTNDFQEWCDGQTGFPIVDAAMRQLNTTGFMHNRLRMIAANFLTKDLCIDWRWGERYFASKLLDYDLSQNLGGWQWSAGIGADAQPYFRVFNPAKQSRRFDPNGDFIRRFVPELSGFSAKWIHEPHRADPAEQRASGCRIGRDYPPPMVDHDTARRQCLATFKAARKA